MAGISTVFMGANGVKLNANGTANRVPVYAIAPLTPCPHGDELKIEKNRPSVFRLNRWNQFGSLTDPVGTVFILDPPFITGAGVTGVRVAGVVGVVAVTVAPGFDVLILCHHAITDSCGLLSQYHPFIRPFLAFKKFPVFHPPPSINRYKS
jgi:hypothetical protein